MPAAATAFHTLIVEDDPSASDVISRALRKMDMEPVTAVSVGAALLKIEQEWPPAVILDLRPMPTGLSCSAASGATSAGRASPW